jgi:hypothetical protein
MRRVLLTILVLLAFAGAALGQNTFMILPANSSFTGITVGSNFTQQLATSGGSGNPGNVTWSVVQNNLPPGFVFDTSFTTTRGTICTGTLNPSNNAASCTGFAPSNSAGSGWYLTVSALDTQTDQTATKTYTFSISQATSNPPSINSQTLPVAIVGQAYSYQFTASGLQPFKWNEVTTPNTFPGSFSLSTSGVFSSPQVTQADFNASSGGHYTFGIQVRDANGLASTPAQFTLTISQGLTITTNSPLPSGIVGVSYGGGSGLQLQATGGTGNYVWQIISGSLGSVGLSMSSAGVIFGTPSVAAQQLQFTVQVTDIGVSTNSPPTATKTFTLSVVSSSLSIVQTSLPVAFQNQSYSTTLTAQGGLAPYTWSLGTNSVSALSIGASTGVLSGTPANVPGTYSIAIIVTDSAGSTYQGNFSLTVAANLSIGNSTATGCAAATPSLPNGTQGQTYTGTACAIGGQGPYSWAVSAGSLPTGLTLQSSTSSSVTISGTPTANGTYQFTIKVTDTNSRVATAALQIQIGTNIMITTTSLPDGSQGTTYAQVLGATGGQTPYTWSVTVGSLPAGLTLTTNADSTATIGGTPSGQGPSQFTVQVKDAQGNTAIQALSINIGVPLVITTVSVPNGIIGASYSLPLGASGGTPPYNWTVVSGTLPGGINLNAGNGLLSGTPSSSGNYSFTVQVKDSSGATAQRAFSMSVISQLSLGGGNFTGQVGTVFSLTLSATGGVPPYSFAIQSGTLPAGVTFSGPTGTFGGTPTTAGASSVSVIVTDSSGATATASITITISLNTPPALTIGAIAPNSNGQPALALTIGGTYPVDLTGTLVLSFTSSVGGDDQTVTYTDGTRSVNFTIPANTSTAKFPTTTFGVRTGTVAGTITLRVTNLTAGTANVTPSPAPQQTIVIAPAPPVITSISCTGSSSGMTVSVTGFTNTRSMVSGTFNFTAPAKTTISSGSSSILVQLGPPFTTYFATTAANATGGQFTLTMPFTLSAGSGSGFGVTAAVGNSVGGSNTLPSVNCM